MSARYRQTHSATHSSQANASVRCALILYRRWGRGWERGGSGGGGKEEEEEKPPSLEWFVLIFSWRVKPVYYILVFLPLNRFLFILILSRESQRGRMKESDDCFDDMLVGARIISARASRSHAHQCLHA